GSVRSLLGSGPAQIQFSPSGNALVVTNKATSTLDTFVVDASGAAGAPHSFHSSGSTPFGFAFGLRDELVVSEAAGAPAGLFAAPPCRPQRRASPTANPRDASERPPAAKPAASSGQCQSRDLSSTKRSRPSRRDASTEVTPSTSCNGPVTTTAAVESRTRLNF